MLCVLLLLLEFGLLCILECLVNSSDRLKRFVQPGNWQLCGFSPVCVRYVLSDVPGGGMPYRREGTCMGGASLVLYRRAVLLPREVVP